MIRQASFVKSCPSVENCPSTHLPEYAFIGRSNVGKSSLVNMLTNVKGLAMTSAKPGKTLLINYFLIDETWHLVDLPGYGYAQAPKKQRDRLEGMIKGYILRREQLTNLFVLIDSRHEPQKNDTEFIQWLGENGIPFSIIFTKTDKQTKGATLRKIEAYKRHLLETWETLPPIFACSSVTKAGKEEIVEYIEKINQDLTHLVE